MQISLKCLWCGDDFTPRTKVQKCCSRVCGNRLANKNTNIKVARERLESRKGKTCEFCLKGFMPKRTDAKFCSVKCTNKHHWQIQKSQMPKLREANCAHCAAVFMPSTVHHKHCSDACAKARSYSRIHAELRRQRLEMQGEAPRRPCIECGKTFTATHRDRDRQKFCTPVCLARHHMGEVAARRAAVIRSSTSDEIDWKRVAERYQWKCAACETELSADARGKRIANTPEVDHIVPISKGGLHVYANLQLLCFPCNRTKAARVVPGVVSLFATGDC